MPPRRDALILAALAAAFLAWHVPLMFRTAPGLDEDFYGVPGTAVLRSGLPQIPYIPSRDPATIYFHADEALYALPPLFFYAQAAVHLILGDGIGPARLTSTLFALLAFWLVYDLARAWSAVDGDRGRSGPLLAAGLFLFSRACAFPATTARPDMAAAALGLLAVKLAAGRPELPGWWRTIGAGIAVGLAMLAHPLGAVPAAQVGIGFLLDRRRPIAGRFLMATIFTAAAIAALGLWLPLIALHPDWFRIQFGGNVTGRAGPGLGRTLLDLPGVLLFQAAEIADHLGPLQTILAAAGLVWALGRARRGWSGRALAYHAAASVLLLFAFMGRHVIRGYYVYPFLFAAIGAGGFLGDLAARLGNRLARLRPGLRAGGPITMAALLAIALVPGSGLRTLREHLRHWDDPRYRYDEFLAPILDDLPPDSLVAADAPYALGLYLAGRPTVEAIVNPFYYDVRTEPFAYVLLGREGVVTTLPRLGRLEFVRAYGEPTDPFGLYAELYRRPAISPRPRRPPSRPAGAGDSARASRRPGG